MAAVVKADGYGLGAARVAPALAEAGCDSFFVARLEEGVALAPAAAARAHLCAGWRAARCGAGADQPSPDAGAEFAWREIAAWSAAAGAAQRALDAVIHVDTGMNRLGLAGDELAHPGGGTGQSGLPGSIWCW